MFKALFGGFEPGKLKSHLKMGARRLQLVRQKCFSLKCPATTTHQFMQVKNKRLQFLKKSRREIALLIQSGEWLSLSVIRSTHQIHAALLQGTMRRHE